MAESMQRKCKNKKTYMKQKKHQQQQVKNT